MDFLTGVGGRAREIYRRRALAVEVELFDDVGHLFWWEDPDRTATLLVTHTTA
ncbi:hypothetical protein [Kribbella pittospori]|uniref:hypothetical protein n=1 Tax=Kribbella pittospori TaxID=722689 RepID=UPI0013F3FDD5|nr:hypothetical protein [Kribbella pittospori]